MLKTEIAESLGMHYMQAERVIAVYGIGGRETVYTHHLNRLIIGNHAAIDFYVEVGEMIGSSGICSKHDANSSDET